MKALWALNILLAIFFLVLNVHAQLPPEFEGEEPDKDDFIEPKRLESNADSFIRHGMEFIFLSEKMPFSIADLICKKNYYGRLAVIRDWDLAAFLAEAFSETNLHMDALWLAGKKDYNTTEWYWKIEDTKEPIDQDFVDKFVYNVKVNDSDRLCLTFSRKNHDKPQFQPITCKALRASICERAFGGGADINSTYPGWIQLGNRYYKIFNERVDWDTAVGKCFLYDHDATLAVVRGTRHVEQLGRYLLIGRPSLENAWLDGKYIDGSYHFEQENIVLPNISDATGFPPWRYGEVTKKNACILIDRHLKKRTLFVEARCERFRPYICYKIGNPGDEPVSDVIVGNHGYRLHYAKKTWHNALSYCKHHYANYSAYLTEVREKVQFYHLLYVMGENRTAVRHIWLGGKYHEVESPSVWRWNTDGELIPTGYDSVLNWVVNRTYTKDVEESNICLKMDRENHIVGFVYGSFCLSEQSFVCTFTADELRRLESDEFSYSSKSNEVPESD